MFVLETKLKNEDNIELTGFTWYGRNRKSQLKTARCGSGGLGVFIKNVLLKDWEVKEIDSNLDGLYVICLVSKLSDCRMILCPCYLAPERSTWGMEADRYFNHLSSI